MQMHALYNFHIMTENKPNILIIMTDQHRADLMTCAGRDLVPTPNIDEIASKGVRFQNAFCPYPVCVASRMCLLTGLYSHSTGAVDNTDQLDWRYRTMANHFSDNGYLTGLIGKMHFNNAHNYGFMYYMSINDWLMYLGPKVRHYANEIASHPHGTHFFKTVFDTGAGFPDMERLWENDKSPWVGNVERYSFDSMASELEMEDHLDAFIARESVKFLQQYKDQRFFLVTSFMKPHTPFFPPREWAEKYPVDEMELPPVGNMSTYPPHIQKRIKNYMNMDEKYLKAGRAGYLGNLAFVDTCIGRVYKALEKLELIDNTIVIYTSDHGEMDGDHGLYQKFCLFESSVKVPLIVSWPGLIPENKVTEALTEYFGIYPTLVEMTNTAMSEGTTLIDMPDAPENIDSSSFASILRDPDLHGPMAVFCEYALKSKIPQYMIRTHRYKYNFNRGTMHELYDLEVDPGEYRNLINDSNMKKVINNLTDQLFECYNPNFSSFNSEKS
ncbi:sulfatase-like hydrolase/transferase [Candidatus Poribacteria bacterium]|nr:sulfatase-like hydrolase/transferase [Candidatus Poribacteria bacterium]